MPEIEQKPETENVTELTAEEVAELVADAPAVDASAFVPTDEGGVDWVLGKMADHRARAQRIRENAELMARAEERKVSALEWRYGAALQTWLRAQIEGGHKKSVRLFHGVVGLRQKPAGIHVTDPAAALAWARENAPAAVTEGLDKKEMAAALAATGESLDFAQLTPAEDVFYIK